jgi:hypothetical protein
MHGTVDKKDETEGLIRIDIGCGKNKKKDFIGWDKSPKSSADLIIDVRNTPWPLGDKSVDEAFTAHFFEHLTGEERMVFMNELYRVMKEGAKVTIITPFYSSTRSIQDPTHAWPPLCEASYLYFNKEWRETQKLDHYEITADFDYTFGYAVDTDVGVRSLEYQQFAIKHYINSVLDLQVVLTRRPDEESNG